MRLFEFTQSSFNPLLVKFWKSCDQNQLNEYFVLGNCNEAAKDLSRWLYHTAGMGRGEIVDIGYMTQGGRFKKGWFETDVLQIEPDMFNDAELAQFEQAGVNYKNKSQVKKFIIANGLEQKYKMIPHSWVEFRSRGETLILDPSGFYTDGQSGQFDNMVKDKTNLASRYHYF